MTPLISSMWVSGASLSVLWKWVSHRQARATIDFVSPLLLGGTLIEMHLTLSNLVAATTAKPLSRHQHESRNLEIMFSYSLFFPGVFGENARSAAGPGHLQAVRVGVWECIHIQKDPPETRFRTRQTGAVCPCALCARWSISQNCCCCFLDS